MRKVPSDVVIFSPRLIQLRMHAFVVQSTHGWIYCMRGTPETMFINLFINVLALYIGC